MSRKEIVVSQNDISPVHHRSYSEEAGVDVLAFSQPDVVLLVCLEILSVLQNLVIVGRISDRSSPALSKVSTSRLHLCMRDREENSSGGPYVPRRSWRRQGTAKGEPSYPLNNAIARRGMQ